MAIDLNPVIRIDYLQDPLFIGRGIRLGVLRLDRIHPVISGNKWFKLKENIAMARESHKTTLLTFGGAYSNHLIATAAAASGLGFSAIGLVRGLHATERLSPTLEECGRLGMQLVFLSKADYRLKADPEFLRKLQIQYPHAYIIPEGGNNGAGREGVREIVGYLPSDAENIVLPVGSGTTLAGIRKEADARVLCLGFAPFKNGAYLKDDIASAMQCSKGNWDLCFAYHFGGFAKYTQQLIAFMNMFYGKFKIPLDFLYTGKMMFGLMDLIGRGEMAGRHIIAIHTGGLQGNESIKHLLDY